ncbi:hypothetical protein QAD02_014289 [Eretmocerus hayati]|uniref:Uncharacterized protein n=1 Tax=Eretmocerus hayati TaxID=131215 RepID=A0ACC2P528_9HYME|nr:hypothetical protein QAD02_014289 [Eretmocerus hayati]
MIRRVILTIFLALVALCSEIELSAADDCRGCVQLNSLTFDKVIEKFKVSFVKFDVAFPYGDKHEEFIKVAQDTAENSDLLVAEVGVKDFGNKDNAEIAKRFDINKDDYPTLLLFVKGKTEPFKFTPETDADFTADNMKRFIRKKSGTYLGLPGCIERLDRLAEEFKQAISEKDRQEILNKARQYEETSPEKHRPAIKVYVKTMERILERGDVFVQTEQTRIEGILKSKLSEEKKRTMEEKRNILQSFTHKDEL